MSVQIESRGLQELIAQVSRIPGDTDEAAYLAVNTAARNGRVIAARQMENEINFPKSYLKPAAGRLTVSKFAKLNDPEAHITGRDRATSLARFATSKPKFGRQRGLTVRVAAGRDRRLPNAFFMRLRNDNVGLAIRVPKGTSLHNSRGAKDLGNGLWLLYGPSVNQVFQGVAADVVGDVSTIMENEFDRQFNRLQARNQPRGR